MSDKFLNRERVSELWGKIKVALLGKQDALTAGPGIKIEGNVISAEDLLAWVETELPASIPWYSVTYGNGKFVAVGYGNTKKAAYSEDGITWTEITMPSSANWYSVAYGNGKFVVITNSSNKAVYSTDGIIWTETILPLSASWYNVTYGNGKFVAVAENTNKAAYSKDGVTWIEIALPSSAKWRSITYGDGKFVMVANSTKKAAYSEDGIAWTETTLPSSGSWSGVTYGDGKFVAVAQNNIIYSTDGITWTKANIPSLSWWYRVSYGNGKFVAVAFDSDKAAYSSNGINWKETTLPFSASWFAVAYGNGKFVAVAGSSNKAACAAMTCVTFDGLNDELALKGDELALDGQTLSLKSGDDVLSSVELPGGGGSYSGEVYSTEERRIGTWINGKPIYRKVVSGVLNSSAGNLISVTGETSEIDTVLRLDTKLIPKGSAYIYFGTSFHEGTSTWFDTFAREGNVLINCGPTFNECTATVIVEYTKTTDQPTIPLPEAETNILQEDWPGAAEDETVREEV